MPGISWRFDHRRLILPVSILPASTAENAHQSELVTGLLDTGATGTGLRSDVIERLSLQKRGRRRIFTANGDLIANEHLIRIGFHPGAFEEHPFDLSASMPFVLDREFLAHSLHPNFSFEMIIGMDVLGQTDLSIHHDGRAHLQLF